MDAGFMAAALEAFRYVAGREPSNVGFEQLDLARIKRIVDRSPRIRMAQTVDKYLFTQDERASYQLARGQTLAFYRPDVDVRPEVFECKIAFVMSFPRSKRSRHRCMQTFALDAPNQAGERCGLCGKTAIGKKWRAHLECWSRFETQL